MNPQEKDIPLWVPKRWGWGWNLNFANPKAWWVLAGILAIIAGVSAVSIKYRGLLHHP
jgi:uncharacterized membrane protein